MNTFIIIILVLVTVWNVFDSIAISKNAETLNKLINQTNRRLNNLEHKISKLEVIVWEDIKKDDISTKDSENLIQEKINTEFEKFNF